PAPLLRPQPSLARRVAHAWRAVQVRPEGLGLDVVVEGELAKRRLGAGGRIHPRNLLYGRQQSLVAKAVIVRARLPDIGDGPLSVHLTCAMEDQARGWVAFAVHRRVDPVVHVRAG